MWSILKYNDEVGLILGMEALQTSGKREMGGYLLVWTPEEFWWKHTELTDETFHNSMYYIVAL